MSIYAGSVVRLVADGGWLKHEILTAKRFPLSLIDTGPIWFYIQYQGRRRRCGITAAALDILGPQQMGLDPASGRAVYRRHKDWIAMLARIELEERPTRGPLILTASHVRFQFACDETPDLPDVLCF